MFCPKCGTQNPDDAAFCKGCGGPLKAAGAPAAPAAAGAASGAAAAAGGLGNKKPLIALAAIVVVLIAVVAFAVSTCSGDGDKLTPGIYQLSYPGSDYEMKVVMNDDGTGTLSQPYHDESISFAFEPTGAQDGSTIYTVSDIHANDGSYIDENGVMYDEDGEPRDDTLESIQFMVPQGGTTGKVAGLWGLLTDVKTPDGTHEAQMVLAEVKDDGTGMVHTLYAYDIVDVPSFDLNAVAANESTYSYPFTWEQTGEGSYKLTNEWGDSYTVTMPTAK